MIASLSGVVTELSQDRAVIETAGIGFEVFVSRAAQSLCREGQVVSVKAFLQTAESGMTLFGFADGQERDLFLALTTVKGVGGKMAMTLLQSLSAAQILTALTQGDSKLLTSAPGVGKKTAERLCFELGAKLGQKLSEDSFSGKSVDPSKAQTILEALQGLGFERGQALKALERLMADEGEPASIEEGIYGALKYLNR